MQGWTNNLIKLKYLMVPNHLNVTHGWKRYMLCVSKQEGPSAKCCYYVQDMSPDATDDQTKNNLITGYSDLQGLGCKQAAYDNITRDQMNP